MGSAYCNLRLQRAFSGPAKTLLAVYMATGGFAYATARFIEFAYFSNLVKKHLDNKSLDELEYYATENAQQEAWLDLSHKNPFNI